eukprot:TRINITY_DN7907_c0_g1_i1.p1 TRINITY_DN7907_c0_g1~~TRINITY_DN7907_c0_g1_i1.p1  ORF type:complete len:1078 (+),score=192.27 TRINITY_DN7907_c0_g1_i1:87-3320(+)
MDFDSRLEEICDEIPLSQGLSQLPVQAPLNNLLQESDSEREALNTLDRKAAAGDDIVKFLQVLFHGTKGGDGMLRAVLADRAVHHIMSGVVSGTLRDRCIFFLSSQADSLPPQAVVSLAWKVVDGLCNGRDREGAALDILPKLLAIIDSMEELPKDDEEDDNKMTKEQLKSVLVDRICESNWHRTAVINVASALREVHLSTTDRKAIVEKIAQQLREIPVQETPPVAYQLLMMCSKGLYGFVLHELAKACDEIDRSLKPIDVEAEGQMSCGPAPSANRTELLRAQGTMLLHINFSAKQDQALCKGLIKYIKAHRVPLKPFLLAILLAIARIPTQESMIMDFLRAHVMGVYKEAKKRANSSWLCAVAPIDPPSETDAVFLETIENSHVGWDHIIQALVKIGFVLADKFDKCNQSAMLGFDIVVNCFCLHQIVRTPILEQLFSRIITAAKNASGCVTCLQQLVAQKAHEMSRDLTQLKEALEYLSYMSPTIGRALIAAVAPLFVFNPSFLDHVVLVLRKALFSRELSSRLIAVDGILQLLHSVCFSEESSVDTERLQFELVGCLRRCLGQQAEVREHLYEGLPRIFQSAPKSQAHIYELLYGQLEPYYEWDEGVLPPLNLSATMRASKENVKVLEPIVSLLSCIEDCMCSDSGDAGSSSSSENVAVRDMQSHKDRLRAMMESISRRTLKSELADWELDNNSDYSTPANIYLSQAFSGMLEVLMEWETTKNGTITASSLSKAAAVYGVLLLFHEAQKQSRTAAAGKKGTRGPRGKSAAATFKGFRSSTLMAISFAIDEADEEDDDGVVNLLEDALAESFSFVEYLLKTCAERVKQISELPTKREQNIIQTLTKFAYGKMLQAVSDSPSNSYRKIAATSAYECFKSSIDRVYAYGELDKLASFISVINPLECIADGDQTPNSVLHAHCASWRNLAGRALDESQMKVSEALLGLAGQCAVYLIHDDACTHVDWLAENVFVREIANVHLAKAVFSQFLNISRSAGHLDALLSFAKIVRDFLTVRCEVPPTQPPSQLAHENIKIINDATCGKAPFHMETSLIQTLDACFAESDCAIAYVTDGML